ncbi:hypothetical protein [Burkholderia cepacia]|uniref:Bacteriophage protein n=1 Tax=Burkholderia cepacia TaxID=292 RepID=A0ABM6NVI4_BURCE|nr:hypothetical protein [Burkholderia cepacia]AIO24608.1 hypothetical protein DM41_2928 [Burkholderia cepacia ATCC 25416]ALK18475.1 hypothetical protein APZ15_12030 [Burkholderia cepacia ATCC 25416]ASE96052.1 hypothetical protein CEQ23_22265 [Burkholderia cepacia]ATF78946.1 hypothetical protein CO711_16995 [Burkholderia cepacia]MCA8466919.1 hypothetical protein [Burkholderia cepacia]
MTLCSHDVALEQRCEKCTAEGLAGLPKIAGEHAVRVTDVEIEYYPDHAEPRTESATFRHTKKVGHAAGLRCSISGQPAPEYHHLFCEWADSDGVDWATVRGIALGEIKEIPVLDPETDQPTKELYPAEESFIWLICKLVELRGFDWHAFDPAKPETFVDAMVNMLPLSAKFHRSPTHGIHHRSFPTYVFQAFPRKAGFVFTPDELVQDHKE